MTKSLFKAFSAITILALVLMALPIQSALAVSPDIVISQVYGGGGNSGATYTNDFVELFNRGTSAVSLSGWSVQYASATGTGNFSSNPIALISGTLQPGQYYLVQLAGGTNGVALPTPDATGTVNMSGTGGKVALVTSTTGLACNGGSTACSPTQLALIKDLVGWDGANFYETSPAPSTSASASTAIIRASGGCVDTDNNSADFITIAPPTPRNTSSPLNSCSVTPSLSINDVSLNEGNSGTTTFTFTVSLSAPAGVGGVTFDIATADNSATVADNDYVAKSLTSQTIPAGSSNTTFDVQVNGDTTVEPNETFFVNVTNVAGATVVDGQGQGTIQNDDAAPTPTNPSGSGSASPNTVLTGDSTLLTVVVTPGTNPTSTGLAVSCDLTAIGGSATQAFYDDATNGDVTAGDNTFSYSATVANGTTGGTKSLPCTITDAEARTGSATISLTVTAILPIGTVNGSVSDTEDATLHRSPFAPASGNGSSTTTVTVQGVIYEKTLQATSTASTNKGFFLQNTTATADRIPNTSDGIFVFMGNFTTLIGGYTPTVGDEVVITAKVSEFFNMTELTSATLVKVVRSNVNIDTEVPSVVANPPANLADANRYWERRQSMRVQVPANSIVLGGRNVFSPADAEIWLASPTSTIALRTDPYERRSFRDAHPLDDNYDPNNWDGNGYRILIGSLGIKSAAGDAQALMDPARTFDKLSAPVAGGLNYTFSKYRIEISAQPTFTEGVDPAANHAPVNPNRATEYSIADFNVENLYDYRDNPFSGCDFTGNSGCPVTAPFIAPVNPPYDYVPASDAAYQARLTDIATQIIDVLHAPDILMMQEVENQDICSVSGGALVCGTTDNADGKPDDLQDLALKIASLGGPTYDAAFDRDSSDLRGILPSFMYRTDRVQLLSPVGDPILGSNPAIDSYTAVPYDSDISNPKTLNAVLPAGISASGCETTWIFPRAPDIGLFRIYSSAIGDQTYRDVYVIDNHFKSNPDTCKPNRTEQAKYNAAIVAYLQSVKPNANIVLGGDLNVYARPDDTTPPSDQLASLYDSNLGLKNLYEVELEHAPEAAYTYVFLGMAQTIDQIFVNQSALAHLSDVRTAHINSDFPADYPDDVARGTSDHDPTAARFFFNLAPVATNDSYSVNEDTGLTVSAPGVLANDSDGEGDSLVAVLVSGPSHGVLNLNADGSFSYTPASNFNGSDSFTYQAKDPYNALSNVASVSITVNAVNDAPVATSDSATVAKNSSVAIFVLANDYDVDGDTLTVTSFTQSAHGTVAYSTKNKNFRYTPTKGFSGTDSFTYTISDGHGGTATATVTITVQ